MRDTETKKTATRGRCYPPSLLPVETELPTMRTKGQLQRFENKAQLLRHIAEETGRDLDSLWEEYDEKVE